MNNKMAINTHWSTTETKNNKKTSRKKNPPKIKIGFSKISGYKLKTQISLSCYALIIMQKLIFKKLTITITPKKGST